MALPHQSWLPFASTIAASLRAERTTRPHLPLRSKIRLSWLNVLQQPITARTLHESAKDMQVRRISVPRRRRSRACFTSGSCVTPTHHMYHRRSVWATCWCRRIQRRPPRLSQGNSVFHCRRNSLASGNRAYRDLRCALADHLFGFEAFDQVKTCLAEWSAPYTPRIVGEQCEQSAETVAMTGTSGSLRKLRKASSSCSKSAAAIPAR